MSDPIPQNQASFAFDELVSAVDGKVMQKGAPVTSVSTDTRTLRPGAAFVALRGPTFDGNDHVGDAIARGAHVVVVSRACIAPKAVGVIQVDDTRDALLALGRAHRRRWGAGGDRTLIAVGGSVGKTTTQRSISALLDLRYPGQVHATRANQNNEVGVPMTLLGLTAAHRFAVVEIGTSARGEVARLAAASEPDVAVVTKIGVEHAEGIGDLADIEAEEGDLYAAVKPGGIAVGNADDVAVMRQLERAATETTLTYGLAAGSTYAATALSPRGLRGSQIEVSRSRGEFVWKDKFDVPVLGEAGVYSALCALAIVETLLSSRVGPDALMRALGSVAMRTDGRLYPYRRRDGAVVIDDTYNANPDSMRSSIAAGRNLAAELAGRFVVILGGMGELGNLSIREHAQLAEFVRAQHPSVVLAVGAEAFVIADVAERAGIESHRARDASTAAALAQNLVVGGDVVLVKASRSVKAERIVSALLDSHPKGTEPEQGA